MSLKVFQHHLLMLPKTSGICCGFGCPGSQTIRVTIVIVVNLVFSGVLRGAGGRHV